MGFAKEIIGKASGVGSKGYEITKEKRGHGYILLVKERHNCAYPLRFHESETFRVAFRLTLPFALDNTERAEKTTERPASQNNDDESTGEEGVSKRRLRKHKRVCLLLILPGHTARLPLLEFARTSSHPLTASAPTGTPVPRTPA